MRIAAAVALILAAAPVAADDILDCNAGAGVSEGGNAYTVAFPQDGGCIFDQIEGELEEGADGLVCRVGDPDPAVFTLYEDFSFELERVTEGGDAEIVDGTCTRS